jgi:hypothetical protein
MSARETPEPGKAAAVVPRALLGTSVAVLVVGALLNTRGQTAGGPEALSWAAVAWALVAPLVAVVLRGQGLVAAPERDLPPGEAAARARRTIVFFAVLESAAVLAGVAAIVSPPAWPLAAGLVPVAVMAINLPSRS